jgi:hypothetical protein
LAADRTSDDITIIQKPPLS